MIIAKATLKDLDVLSNLVEDTKVYFKEVGIPQWQGIYPNKDTLTQDIKYERLYAVKEDDKVNPLCEYAKSKAEAEKIVMTLDKYFILRISWVFGKNGNNFI